MELVITGKLQYWQWDETTGDVKYVSLVYENTLTNAFLSRIAQWIGGANNTGQNAVIGPSKFQFGTGTGTTAATDTALFTPTANSLVSIAGANNSGNATIFIVNYPANTISGTFAEVGLLDKNNVLLTHLLLSPAVNVAGNLATTFQYTITVATQ